MEAFQARSWKAWAHSETGQVRHRNEDAWTVVLDHGLGGKPGVGAGVFDGLGGMPRGKEGAWAAADALSGVMRTTRSAKRVLPRLNAAVQESRGTTTGVVAVFRDDGSGTLLSVGDSAVYAIEDGQAASVAPKDAGPGHLITDYLGNPDLRGHVTPITLEPGHRILLCTDGVDRLLDGAALRGLLTADDPPAAIRSAFQAIDKGGAPDNATLVLLERQADDA